MMGFKLKTASWMLLAVLQAIPAIAANIHRESALLSDRGDRVIVDGAIIGGDTEKLREALNEAQKKRSDYIPVSVVFNSSGGDVDVAMAMGLVMRDAGAETYHRYCASACVFAFLGGVRRHLGRAADGEVLNVHRPEMAEAYLANPTPFTGQMMSVLRTYIQNMTGSDSLYETMMTIPYASPRNLRPAEALSMQVVTPEQP